MKPWDELTEAGKFRRLRPLAMAALQQYPIQPTKLSLVGGFTNVVFRIDTPDGPYALRIDYMQEHSDQDREIELAWLEALAKDSDLDVCRVVASRDGHNSVLATAPGVPGERSCVLFEWVPGKPLHDHLSGDRYHRLGQISAGLHIHADSFQPPHRPMAWDKVFYWPEDLEPIVHHLPEHAHHFTNNRRPILERAIAAVEPAFKRLDPATAQVIHADVHPWNVHVHRSRLIVLDFEDVAWGHRVQDVAITLFYERDHPRYSDLRAAFREGYRTVAPWPVTYEGELEHFMAARTISFVNFVLRIDDGPAEFFDRAFPRLERFLADWGY